MLKYDLYIFDFDGTLVDSYPAIIATFRHVLSEFKLAIPKEEILKSFIGPVLKDTYQNYFSLQGAKLAKALKLHKQYFSENSPTLCEPFSEITSLLKKIKVHNKKLAIATSRYSSETKQILNYQNILNLFDYIKGAKKSQPSSNKSNLYRDVLDNFNIINKSILIIGDSKYDIEAAQILGVHSVFAGYGYGTIESIQTLKPDFIVNSVTELSKLILN